MQRRAAAAAAAGAAPRRRRYDSDARTVWFKSDKANGFAWLSNFWPDVHPAAKAAVSDPALRSSPGAFDLDGHRYATAEHFYQASKYERTWPAGAEAIRAAPTAAEAKRANTRLRRQRPADASALAGPSKAAAMLRALRAKFEQNEALGRALVGLCAGRTLCEVPGRGGGCWAAQRDGSPGLLGRLLMQVRDDLASDPRFCPQAPAPQEDTGDTPADTAGRRKRAREEQAEQQGDPDLFVGDMEK
eukprot:m51a1_g10246 hypothetical protein (245) ;mRNA; r:38474-39208